jgi:phospholipase D1/2
LDSSNNNDRRMRFALLRLTAISTLVLIALIFWRYSPFSQGGGPGQLGLFLDTMSASPWAGPIVVGMFLIGSFVVFPVTAMIAATGVALGPADGMVWASAGALIGASVNYGIARALPESAIEALIGSWIGRLGQKMERGGILAVMLARNFPFAPFTVINVVSGAARIPYRDFLIGTVLGMGPVIAALTLLGDRLRAVWEVPTMLNVSLLAAAILIWFAIAVTLQSLSNRRWSRD